MKSFTPDGSRGRANSAAFSHHGGAAGGKVKRSKTPCLPDAYAHYAASALIIA
jgi:hypothetical protein